jgi:hypothetical protein
MGLRHRPVAKRGGAFAYVREGRCWRLLESREDVMKQYLTVVALTAALAQPATAVTFPSLTTIYIGSGVRDDGGSHNAGAATVFHCSNVSGVTAEVRFLILNWIGTTVELNHTAGLPHGRTFTLSTHSTVAFSESVLLSTGLVDEGLVNIESTQSGVFCTAKTIDASTVAPEGVTLPLVRVNPHPGTVE